MELYGSKDGQRNQRERGREKLTGAPVSTSAMLLGFVTVSLISRLEKMKVVGTKFSIARFWH